MYFQFRIATLLRQIYQVVVIPIISISTDVERFLNLINILEGGNLY